MNPALLQVIDILIKSPVFNRFLDALMAAWLKQRYQVEMKTFKEALNLARTSDSTIELQKVMGKHL